MTRHLVSGSEAVNDGLRGFCAVNADLVALHEDPRFVLRAEPATDKVALVSGGGSGHEPLHAGFVGVGMLDAAVPGEVFSSPSADQVRAAMLAADAGRGVLQIVKNYTGDVINFALAADECRDRGVEVASVLVDDDVPSAERGSTPGRRGTVATVLVEKICGAAAEEGRPLAELAELGQRVVDRSRSVGAAVAAGSNFTAEPAFELGADEIEFGVGIHGERGTDRIRTEPLEALVRRMLDTLADDLPLESPVLLAVNGLGATTPLELDAAAGYALAELDRRGIEVSRAIVDDLVTSLDMRGLSLTVLLLDDELQRWWDAPVQTAHWRGTRLAGVPAAQPKPATITADETTAAAAEEEGSEAATDWIDRFVERAGERADELGELDRQSGDGDFGPNLRTALGRYRAGGDAFVALSRAFAGVGGTSGPLLALWLRTLARGIGGDPGAYAEALRTAADRVRELGGAEVGDKTMVDAMVPAAEAAQRVADADGSLDEAIRAAAEAADRAAEQTSELVARRGRGSYVGEAGRGVVDPGARLIAIFLGCGVRP
ncbi:dihydroxyacetone kinase family protein [Enemella evansiae]|uniref:Dihydroxyacetone kinase n=1 Tax=Enemella evansiae TaxID=2016499 RepID=A0A255GJF3_9ACTN|nr:dihydroxyacetone kinase family protein [Enemella evansiae]OYO09311.1 dihydroxyacetone kinase [Enemella evansiae]OYO15955.1 dihydroxyacetone kinase [Enemella evansiae]TDO89980.1 homodimeric dihydroxyacetone kinase [Enemella evansiae]